MREPRFYENPSCASVGGDFWYPEKIKESNFALETTIAKSICGGCSHRTECAEWGIYRERYGIWGALTEKERWKIRREKDIELPRSDVA